MKRIKTMGIAVVMALALTAFAGAGTASANNFKVGVEPAKWSGSLTGSSHVLSLGADLFTCTKPSFSGETVNKTISDVTVAPELNGCAHSGFPATWSMNGCKFRFRAGPGPALVGSLDIVGCEKPMSYASPTGCQLTIGNQSGLGTVTYKNVATSPATMTAVANLNSLTYTRGSVCGTPGTFSNGTYTGEWTIKAATIPGGVPAAAEIESTPAPPLSKFAAEEAPVTLSGVGGGAVLPVLHFQSSGTIYCESITYSGTISTVSAAAIALAPVYQNCSVNFNGGSKTKIPDENITAGGCSYEVLAKGGSAIVGAGCAASPISITIPGCVLTVGPQSGFAGPTVKNEGSGKLRKVKLSNESGIPKLTYTATGPGCVKPGTFSEATARVSPLVSATNSGGAAQGFWVE